MHLCLFNLTDSFHTFFLEVARLVEARGWRVSFFNFWPGEVTSLTKNGSAPRLVDWKSDFLSEQVAISEAQLDDWLRVDPRYLTLAPAERPAERNRFRRAAAHLLPTFRRFIARQHPDVVFLWNGYRFPEPVMAAACREAGVTVLYGENGFFPNTMQIDTEGINAASSLRHRPTEQWGADPARFPDFRRFIETGGKLPVPGNPLTPAKPVTRAERLPSLLEPFVTQRAIYGRLARKSPFRNALDNRRIAAVKARRPSTKGVTLPERYIFLPFQVHDDTQIVIHSPWVDRMETMLRAVLRARAAIGCDLPIVVKEHPVDIGRYDYEGLPERREVAAWLWDQTLEEVMPGAAVVVTVNSTVGLEAVVAGKPVVTLGNALYNHAGIVHHAAGEGQLAGALQAALSTPIDEAWRHRFLCQLRFEDLLSAHWARPTDAGAAAAADRIIQLAGR
jgi:capsular polysaccharide export protein